MTKFDRFGGYYATNKEQKQRSTWIESTKMIGFWHQDRNSNNGTIFNQSVGEVNLEKCGIRQHHRCLCSAKKEVFERVWRWIQIEDFDFDHGDLPHNESRLELLSKLNRYRMIYLEPVLSGKNSIDSIHHSTQSHTCCNHAGNVIRSTCS